VRQRRGFTFIEIMVSMTIVGLLSAVAVPKYIDLKRRANTTRVIGDFQTVRVAVMAFYADSSYFPAEVGPGAVPPNLSGYLPIGFDFTKDSWQLDYERWPSGGVGGSDVIVGVSVITDDVILAETTSRVLGNVPQVAASPTFTFIISGL
jgi:prepilin-type N-terminal cleavage/methylation domain-containing protein